MLLSTAVTIRLPRSTLRCSHSGIGGSSAPSSGLSEAGIWFGGGKSDLRDEIGAKKA